MLKLRRFLPAVALLVGLTHPSVSAAGEIIDRVLAVAGGQIITLTDVRGAIDLGLVSTPGAGDPVGAALETLIERQLVLAEVERYLPPEPEPTAIEQRVAVIRARFGSAVGLRAALERAGISEARLADITRDDLRIEKYLDQRFTAAAQPTDEDVARHYRDHQADFTRRGTPMPLAEAADTIRRHLTDEQRRKLVAEWIASLRRRGDVAVLYLPSQ